MTLDEMIAKTGIRQEGFRFIVDNIRRRPRIVETGCARQADNWLGDGQSTLIWCAIPGSIVDSYDIDPVAVELCNALTGRGVATCLDGIEGVRQECGEIDLLYLDSLDVDMQNPHQGAMQALFELLAAASELKPDAIVAVDDNTRDNDGRRVGKGMYIAEYMERTGRPLLYDGYQLAWRW